MADATCANLRMRDICCCQDEHNYDGIGVKSCRFGGKRLPMMYRYEPLKVCLNKKKLEFEEECPSICNKNVLLEVSKDKKQLEHEKKEADEEAFREQQESLKDSCLTQEQIKKQYHIEPVKECPQQNIEHLKKMCPLHSKLVNKNPLYPRIQKPPDDCPCRKHLFKEGREDLAYKDCEKILCKNPCEQEKMEKRQCKVECILPNICERPERRHEGLPKKGKWHDLPKCLWDYYDKSSPYWEQEEISQLIRSKTIPGYSYNFDRDTLSHLVHNADEFKNRHLDSGIFKRRTTEFSLYIQKYIEHKNLGLFSR